MCCEVLCCEVQEILNILVSEDAKYLQRLFDFLNSENKLDHYLAGYFEKVLEMLFRRMTVPMMKYLNSSGLPLLELFLMHMENFSIMQIVQRLMLPHIPFNNGLDCDDIPEDDKDLYKCNWSSQEKSCQLLFNTMLDTLQCEVPLHISDLLITVLQLSPPETAIVQFLCREDCVRKLLDNAVVSKADIINPDDEFHLDASKSLAAISVLESLLSRLLEVSLPYDQTLNEDCGTDVSELERVKTNIGVICDVIGPFINSIQCVLKDYLQNDVCSKTYNQSKNLSPRLGHRGLQLVKFVETALRIGDKFVDQIVIDSELLKTCLGLFFKFECNSVLHLSIQRIFVAIIESDRDRRYSFL